MKKLLKLHGLNSDMQYFEKIVKALKDDRINYSIELFFSLSNSYQKKFVESIKGSWNSGLNKQEIEVFEYVLNNDAKKYQVLSPDEITIEFDKPVYKGIRKAFIALIKWKQRYEFQGYYSSNRGRIELEDLINCCNIIKA